MTPTTTLIYIRSLTSILNKIMRDFLGTIYSWFQTFWCENLHYFLWGYDPSTLGFTLTNIYNIVGLITIFVSLVIVLVYYYIINHPRLCTWWSWLITLLVNSVIGLFIGFGIVFSKFTNGAIPDALMYEYNEDGIVVNQFISQLDCWGFSFGCFFVSIIFFVVFTFVFKWWSKNAKHVPFL